MSVLDEVLRAAGAACYPHEDGWRALAVDDGRRSRLLPQFAWRASHTRVAHEWLADLARAGVASVALFSPIGSARDRYVEVPVADAATRIELIAQTSPSLSVFDSRHGVGLLGDPAFQNLDAVTLMGREGGDHIVVTHWSRGNGPSLGPQHDSAARGEHLPLALGIAQVGARVTAEAASDVLRAILDAALAFMSAGAGPMGGRTADDPALYVNLVFGTTQSAVVPEGVIASTTVNSHALEYWLGVTAADVASPGRVLDVLEKFVADPASSMGRLAPGVSVLGLLAQLRTVLTATD